MSLSNSLGLLGRKVGMMRLFTDDGDAVPVTVVDVSNNRVTQVKTQENDGYVALQVTFGSRKASRVTKPQAGHLAKAGVEAGEIIQEFRVTADTAAQYAAGATLPVTALFAVGQKVDVQGTTIGKGYAGTIKRHHMSSQRASHGNSRSHNVPGSIGMAQDPGRVFPGKRMTGHLGDDTRHDPEPGCHPHRRGPPTAADQGCRSRFQGRFRDRSSRLSRSNPLLKGSEVMQLELLNEQGQAASKYDAPETVFGREYNEDLVHQIVVAFQANARQGTRAQKDREQVKHSTKKPFKQKGTGRARAGMTSSPLWRGGGRIFPNMPDENFTQKINKKMYRAGMASIFSQLAREGRLAVVDSMKVDSPKTKQLAARFKAMNLESVLVIAEEVDENLYLASRNLVNVLVVEPRYADPLSLVHYKKVLVTKGAIDKLKEMFA
jgi:large subunit ribosomal protein L4